MLQWGVQKAATRRRDANPESLYQFGLESATRLHEAGLDVYKRQCSLRRVASAVSTIPKARGPIPALDVYKRQGTVIQVEGGFLTQGNLLGQGNDLIVGCCFYLSLIHI